MGRLGGGAARGEAAEAEDVVDAVAWTDMRDPTSDTSSSLSVAK
jgi:hypothetical protein